MASSLFEGYQHEGFFDEFVDSLGEVRPHYRQLALRLGALTPEELGRRERLRDAAFRSAGITFTVYGEDAGLERTFPMDLIPRIIPAVEWAHVEQGLGQRVTALNMVGPWVTEQLGAGYLAVNWEATVDEVAHYIQPHPSLSELFGESVLAMTGRSLHG